MLTAARLEPMDLIGIERQASQLLLFGVPAEPDLDEAEALTDNPAAWTLTDTSGRIVACLGIHESFPGKMGIAWALLAPNVGAAHHALTRFTRAMIEDGARRLARIEALCAPGPATRWATLVGLTPVHEVRQYGAASESYWLCEIVRDGPSPFDKLTASVPPHDNREVDDG